ncbi:hypothetical protein [Streptomyces glaucus]|uniref:Uncharacterized protein n=1 Tax=Streptomyces glaucus TaxID=284029 RepID=A0ABN3J412_9ACTN
MVVRTPRFPGRGAVIGESVDRGIAGGRARTEDVLRVLRLRGAGVPGAARERITGCSGPDVLGAWFDRVLTAADPQELSGEA